MSAFVKSRNKDCPASKKSKVTSALENSKSQISPKIKQIFPSDIISTSEEMSLLQFLVNGSRDEIIIVDEEGNILYLNDAAAQGFGYPPHDCLSKKLYSFMEQTITPRIWKQQYIGKVKKSKHPTVFMINRKNRKGKLQTLEVSVSFFPLQNGTYFLSIGKNITHQIDLLKKLRDSESFYRQVCEQSSDAICTLSLDGKIIYANKAAEDIVKAKLSKDKITHFSQYIEPESGDRVKTLFNKVKAGERVAFEKARIIDKNGKVITIEMTSFPVYKSGKVSQIHCIFRDIGKRLQLENIVLESQKMKAVQLFISGTTHEIQNPLQGLLTRAQILIDKYGDRSFEYIGYNEFKNIIQALITMRDQIKYCCDTNSRLMDISQRKIKLTHSTSCDVNAMIRETVVMFEHELKMMDITLKMKLSQNVPCVAMSRIDLNQIFVNIFTNAIQSMLGGSEITVRTKYLKKEHKVQIDCQDQGIGISKDILPRVFEPFFTTKQRGLKKNAGLGLSIVYSIVKAAKGNIRIASNEKRGTTVQIFLPCNGKKA